MPRTHDVVVLGGGLPGCAIARELAIRGADVLVVEAPPNEPVDEPRGLAALAASLVPTGRELAEASLAMYPEWADTLEALSNVDIGFARCEGAEVAFDRVETRRLTDRGGDIQDPPSERRHPHLSDHASAQRPMTPSARVDLGALASALTTAAERAGVAFTHDLVSEVRGESSPLVVGRDGHYGASQLVFASPSVWGHAAAEVYEDVRVPELQLVGNELGPPVVLASARARLVTDGGGRVTVYGPAESGFRRREQTLREVRVLMEACAELMPRLRHAVLTSFSCVLGVRGPDGAALVGPVPGRGRWGFGLDPRTMGVLLPAGATRLADLIQAA